MANKVVAWMRSPFVGGWRLVLLINKWLKTAVLGARFPRWMEQSPEWVSVSAGLASGTAGSMSGISSGHARGWWIVGTFVFGATVLAIGMARSNARARELNLVETLNEDRQDLLGNKLTNLIQVVAEAMAEPNKALRAQRTHGVRGALITATANLVGRSTAAGTVRANLFQWSDDTHTKMVLAPIGFAGRGTRSVRTFEAGDRPFDRTMNDQSLFVRSVKDDPAITEDLEYETFLTFPVAIGTSRIHGMLTADSTKSGDLVPEEDRPMMAILAALLAITFECEKYANTRN